MPLLPLRARRTCYWQVFGLCLALAAVLFVPHCVIDGFTGGFFHYAGDFNDQMIPFYAYANDFVKQGGSFSWATDLGSGFVNAYSYYCLGSPFFWLTILIPARWLPFTMVPMLCLKFAVAGSGAYLWMRRWVRSEEWSIVGGVLYAFCGFNIYNIFFYFFLDAPALFPYMLAALDDAVLDRKYGRFPFWVALNLLNNYFFFAGQAVFLIVYFVCMCVSKRYRLNLRLFARLAFETILGCAAGCVLLIPAGLSLLQNPRTIDPFNGYGYLVYGKAQQYLAILYSAFIMPDAPYLTDMFSEGITKWTSLSVYLPVVGIAAGLAFCRVWRRHPFTRILKVCLVCAFVPVLNSAFYALNSSYYARWYYMPILILCAASAIALRTQPVRETEIPRALGLAALVTLSAVAFALVPNTDEDGNFVLGVVNNQYRFWGLFLVSALGVGLFALILWRGRLHPRRFSSMLLAGVLGFSFLYGTVHISIAKYGQWDNDLEYPARTWGDAEELNALLPQDGFYRIDAYECYNNMGIWLDKSCIQCFHSTAAPHVLEFYPSVGVTRDVSSKPDTDLFALRGLLSVRYTLVPEEETSNWEADMNDSWALVSSAEHYAVYENQDWVPMGFTYDYYITPDRYEQIPEEERSQILMKALLLTEEQVEEWGGAMEPLPDELLEERDYESYVQDCARRRSSGVTGFAATRTGFSALSSQEQATLVFFSVPYDDGFTATVNGESAPVLKVDNGLMAVPVPAGESEIVFTYRTPGLGLSVPVSLGALVIYGAYLLWLRRKQHKKGA